MSIDSLIENEIDNLIDQSIQNINMESSHSYNNPSNANNANDANNANTNEEMQYLDSTTENNINVEVFNNALNQYLRINEEIQTLLEAVKLRNQAKKQLAETISNFLKINDIKNVNLEGSYKGMRLETETKNVSRGFSKINVVSAIREELNENDEIFEKVMLAISKTSIMKEVSNLKLIQDKTVKRSRKQANKLLSASALLDE
jgi:hypothetical protein